MSTTSQTGSSSTNNFTAILNAASTEYHRVTRKRLDTHPFAALLDTCDTPETILNLFRTQAKAFSKFGKGDERWMAWLDPIVHILFVFSGTLGEGIGLPFSPAKTIFTSIGVLLGVVKDVVASHDSLINLFERIHFFLQRLNSYTGMPLTSGLTELLGMIMAQILSVLALSTKAMTERRIKRFLKTLVGRREVEDALLRLDSLTKEESLMAVARNLEATNSVDRIVHSVGSNVKAAKEETHEIKQNQLRDKFRAWLSPPDPSINHNTACEIHHDETAGWFIEGGAFQDWKEKGSLLWIRGNPGAGKSILCSAIIEDIKSMRHAGSALMAYYYFDFKDASKRDARGLLTSLLFQLGNHSDRCWDVLHQLYTRCDDGSEQPSDASLVGCLRSMLASPGQVPIFIILDALDECPCNTGTPSAREKALNFVEKLVASNHSNLFICITSRPEQDIQFVLNPLTPARRQVSLHEEHGQREDINRYVRSFVRGDITMRRWREEDKELVINTLSKRADGMFRWVYCQLDTLRRCMPSSLRKALNELPITLDYTYERALEGIPKEKWQHAHRLFQCLVAAIRPLRVEELAEIFAIDFDPESESHLLEGWRPDNPEEAVLSACSTLISIIEDEGSKIVQFSHFSVKEFLISDRLQLSDLGSIRQYHILLDGAHTVLAQACLTVLLQLDENVDKKFLARFPLVFYAAEHWVDHVKSENVASQFQGIMERLFNPKMSYLAAWAWVHNLDQPWDRRAIDDLPEHPPPLEATPLYYAALCGFSGLANYLIVTHAQDVNAKCGYGGTPLHAALREGHLEVIGLLLDHGADINSENNKGEIPLVAAYRRKNVEAIRLLLKHGAPADVQHGTDGLMSHDASYFGRVAIVELLLEHNADVNAGDRDNWTPLIWASAGGRMKVVQLLLERGADINAQSNNGGTSLSRASRNGYLDVVRVLLEHGADVRIRHNDLTPLQVAISQGHTEIAKLLLEYGAEEDRTI